MFKLENLAKNMFLDYGFRKTGIRPDWRYLSAERKLAWLKEVTDTFDMCLEFVGDDMKLPPSIGTPAASYEKGFMAGQAFENRRLIQRLEALKETLRQQIDDFEVAHANSKD